MQSEADPDSPKMPVSLARNRDFHRLFLAHTGSLLGTTLTMSAMALLAENLLGEGKGASLLGVAFFIRIAVYVFLAPLAGNVAERLGRRRVMIGMDIFRAGVVIAFLFASQPWHIWVLVFFLNLGSAMFTPVYKSVVPGIVGEKEYPRALALGSMAYKISEVIGPMLAAGIILALDFRSNFVIDALTFLGSALLVMTVRIPEAQSAARKKSDVLFGVRQMLTRPGLRHSLLLALCESVVGSVVIICTASYVIGELDLPKSMYPVAAAAAGIGALMVAIVFSTQKRSSKLPELFARFSIGLLACALLIAAAVPNFGGLFLAWVSAGAGMAVLGIRSNEELAAHSSEEERAHIYAAHFSLSHAGWGIFYPLSGFLSPRIGFNPTSWIFLLILGLVSGLLLIKPHRHTDSDEPHA